MPSRFFGSDPFALASHRWPVFASYFVAHDLPRFTLPTRHRRGVIVGALWCFADRCAEVGETCTQESASLSPSCFVGDPFRVLPDTYVLPAFNRLTFAHSN